MATLNLGKLKPTWKGAYSGATAYTVDDMVSYQGSSYINIQDSTGIDPLDNSYWELIADGANVLTTQGDLTTHDGVVTTRLAIGQEGEVLTAASGDATWAAANGYVGYKALDSNMEPVWGDPNAVNDYGADGKYPWLADYANNWIPQHPIPLGSGNCGPVMRTHKNYGPYRRIFWLNENHELVCRGKDDYFWSGRNGGERHNTGIGVAISAEFGGLKAGEYFVRTWGEQQTFFALTNLGNVFSAGENSEGELGLGDTTHRYMWNKIPYLGPDATLSGLDCKIACLSLSTEGNGQYSGEIGVFAIDVHGRLWAWGDNTSGKLGIGHANNTTVPTHVTALTDVVMVSSAYHTTYFVTKENGGRLYTCGGSPHGVRAGLADSTTPVADATMTGNVWQIILNDHAHYTTAWTTRYSNGFVLKDNGELWTIGANQYGMRGNGNTTESAAWERTGGSLTFAYVKLVGISAYGGAGAIGGTPNSPNGKIYHWGYNGYGACGTGNTSATYSPTQPVTVTDWSDTYTCTDGVLSGTEIAFPKDNIRDFWGFAYDQDNGNSAHMWFVVDDSERLWIYGASCEVNWAQQSHGRNDVIDNPVLMASSWTSENGVTGKIGRTIRDIQEGGYNWGSEGSAFMYTSDGKIFHIGYGGNGQGSGDGNLGSTWHQITP